MPTALPSMALLLGQSRTQALGRDMYVSNHITGGAASSTHPQASGVTGSSALSSLSLLQGPRCRRGDVPAVSSHGAGAWSLSPEGQAGGRSHPTEVEQGQMQDLGTVGAVRRTQPLHLTLPLTQACPGWPRGWFGEEVTHLHQCCWHKKLPQGVWGEPVIAGALPTAKHPAVLRHQQQGGYRQQSWGKPGWMQQHASDLARLPSAMAEGARAGDEGQSSLQKALPGPDVFDTPLHGGMQGKQGCKAHPAPGISCQHPARGLGNRQGSAGCSRTSLCCGWTEGMDSRHTPGGAARPWALPAHSKSVSCPQRGQALVPYGAATAEAPGPGWEETGRETNVFQALSACLGPIFRTLFFCKQSYTKPYTD